MRISTLVSVPVVVGTLLLTHVTGPTVYKNCGDLNRKYPHGVGLNNATDHHAAKAAPVTTFTKDYKVYLANAARDADHDGLACEKR